MNHCPKCSSFSITGPKYARLGWGGEVLRYTCMTCGYTEDRDTHDQAKAAGELPWRSDWREGAKSTN